jgi:hypothetical protein
MGKNQLFRVLPDIDITHQLLGTFGLSSLEDNNFFTKETMSEQDTVSTFNGLQEILETYYLPCKSKVYLKHMDDKKCITILRQFIKIHGYTLISKERYINRKKRCVYRLIKVDDIPKPPTTTKQTNIVINFE